MYDASKFFLALAFFGAFEMTVHVKPEAAVHRFS